METTVQDPEQAKRDAFIDGLRQVADFLDAHPDVKLPYIGGHYDIPAPTMPIYVNTWNGGEPASQVMAKIARAMGTAEKHYEDRHELFMLVRKFGGISLVAQVDRDELCTKVVVGTREVEVEEPEQAAVQAAIAALPKVKRVEVVEEVRWECHPLLEAPDGPLADEMATAS